MESEREIPTGLAAFDRAAITRSIEVLVGLLDLIDGDTDVELNGDEADGNPAEDEFMDHPHDGPGCPVADVDKGIDDDRHDDDDPAEEDDPSGQCDEDGINTNLTAQWASRPGCAISDPDEDDNSDCEHDGREEDDGI